MLGAIIGGVILLIIAAFSIWCVLRISSYESRIEEKYRNRKKGKK